MGLNINIDAKETVKHILMKISSGRWIMTVLFTTTYCAIIIMTLYLVMKDKMKLETFLGLMTGFTAIGMKIVEAYFGRTDRKNGGE